MDGDGLVGIENGAAVLHARNAARRVTFLLFFGQPSRYLGLGEGNPGQPNGLNVRTDRPRTRKRWKAIVGLASGSASWSG